MLLPAQLLHRKADAHKGDFGHIFILAGSIRFSGAALLCAEAAMRAGSGLVTLGIPKGIIQATTKLKPKEVMVLPLSETSEGSPSLANYKKIKVFLKNIDVLLVGPGIGQCKSTQGLARKLISTINKPMVIDADGLNALVGHLDLLQASCYRPQAACSLQPAARILTPHPGEMSRLLGSSIRKIQDNRKEVALKFAKDYKVTLVLKGHNTVVADYAGNLYANKTGNPGMATAGSGDVLTGIIGAFLGQGLNAFNAARYAAYLHGLAGDLAAKKKTQIGMVASDIINMIPEAIRTSS
jgi:hydroxyethylthiazole kinase-like uncharacterized protein yjeF